MGSVEQPLTRASHPTYGTTLICEEEPSNQQRGGIVLTPAAGGVDGESEEEKSARPKMNALNFWNLLFYVTNVVISSGLIALPRTNEEISLQYQVISPIMV
jgi:hypothetical protein